MKRCRFAAVVLVVIGVGVLHSCPAEADGGCELAGGLEDRGGSVEGVCVGPDGTGRPVGDPSPGDEGLPGVPIGAWSGVYGCPIEGWESGAGVDLVPKRTERLGDGRVVSYHQVRCLDAGGQLVFEWGLLPLTVRDLGAEARQVRDQLLAELRAQVAAPVPRMQMAPPADASHLVGVTTWLWVEPSEFSSVSATRSDPAGMTVTLTATPEGLRFHPGDAEVTGREVTVHCSGAGVRWQRGLDDDDTDCLWWWDYPSSDHPDGVFHLWAEADWSFSWEASGELAGYLPERTGTLGTITTTTEPIPLAVLEAQAVLID